MKRIIAMLITLAVLSASLSGCGLSPEEIKALEADIMPTAAPVRASKEKERATPAMAAESLTQGHREATVCATPSSLPVKEEAISPDLAKNLPEEAKPAEKNSVSWTPAPTVEWPYPAITCPPEPELPQITCPPEPEPTPEIDWPYITVPEPPTYTPDPDPTEPPQEQPAPTPVPVVPDVPAGPVPEPTEQPTEQPATPTPEPPTEQPSSGYSECSCGARLTPEEVLTHMKAHALKVENHSYRAY